MNTILVVCTANICRSPMAAALLERRLAELGLGEQVRVQSAGTWAVGGEPAAGPARAVMAGWGLDIGRHSSQPVTPQLLEAASAVVVMEEAQRRTLFYLAPQHLRKVYLLRELAGAAGDVKDPYGGTEEAYRRTAQEIDALWAAGLPRLLKWTGLDAPAGGTGG
jgi:protein-tyrosine-phosphatase